MAMHIDLSGKIAWVTGVSSGIGQGIAERLAEAGCDVVGCGHRSADSDGARAFIHSVQKHGRRAWYDAVDLSDPAGPAAWVDRATQYTDAVNIVVSNAGRNIFMSVDRCSEADWTECINLDLASHWRLAKAAKPGLSTRPGSVMLVISSNHAYSTIPGCFPYNVAKAGLQALVQSLAIEWGPSVRAVGIAPGFIDTPGNDAWFNTFADPAAERRKTEASHPVGRIGTPADIGALSVFLASHWAGFISGSTILIDGGRSAVMQTST